MSSIVLSLAILGIFAFCFQGEASEAPNCAPRDIERIFLVNENSDYNSSSWSEITMPTGLMNNPTDSERKALFDVFRSKLGKSKTTGYSWNYEPWSTFSTVEYVNITRDVPAGIKTVFSQIVGICEPFTVKVAKFIQRDFDRDGHLINKIVV